MYMKNKTGKCMSKKKNKNTCYQNKNKSKTPIKYKKNLT